MTCDCYDVVSDTLDSVLAGSDDETEEDAVISQVLDEIGIEVTSKVSSLCIHKCVYPDICNTCYYITTAGYCTSSYTLSG